MISIGGLLLLQPIRSHLMNHFATTNYKLIVNLHLTEKLSRPYLYFYLQGGAGHHQTTSSTSPLKLCLEYHLYTGRKARPLQFLENTSVQCAKCRVNNLLFNVLGFIRADGDIL